VEKMTFEEALQRLEQTVRQLEGGDLSLETALATFQEGVIIARQCASDLDQAETRIEKLLEQNGEIQTVPVNLE